MYEATLENARQQVEAKKAYEAAKAEAERVIDEIAQEVFIMGNNDREKGSFDEIKDDLAHNRTSPQKAIELAREILSSKVEPT